MSALASYFNESQPYNPAIALASYFNESQPYNPAIADAVLATLEAPEPLAMSLSDWAHPNYDDIYRERVRRLNNIRTNPNAAGVWKGIKEFYKTHPVEFINDWGMTSDPRNAEIGLPITVPFVMFKRQVEFVEWLHARWLGREDGLAEKSRDMGVSWLCVGFSVWMFLFHGESVVGIGSRKEDYIDKIGDPKSLFWKIRKFYSLLPQELQAEGYDERKHSAKMRINNPANGSSIVGEAGDNIGRGGRTSIYFIDEAAHIERPEMVDAALSATSNCKIHVSSVNGPGNPFYKKRHGGEIAVFIFDWRQDPRKSQEWYEKQVRILDPSIVAQEIDRNYEASISNSFIPGELVSAAMLRKPLGVPTGGLRVGIDVARFGDDKTSIVFRIGRVMLKKVKLSKLSVTDVAARARAEISAYGRKPEQIAVDTIGIGAGVADILRGYWPDTRDRAGRIVQTVVDVNSSERMGDGNNYNLRAYMWVEMREWLKAGSLPNDQDLRVDLTALRYGFRGGELLLESKDDAKHRGVKSPDDGDALALTFAKPTIVTPPVNAPRVAAYDPTDSSMGM